MESMNSSVGRMSPPAGHLPAEANSLGADLLDDVPCDTLVAVSFLLSQFSALAELSSPFGAYTFQAKARGLHGVCPFALLSQIYASVPDRTVVDRELQGAAVQILQRAGTVRVLRLPTALKDLAVVLAADYAAQIEVIKQRLTPQAPLAASSSQAKANSWLQDFARRQQGEGEHGTVGSSQQEDTGLSRPQDVGASQLPPPDDSGCPPAAQGPDPEHPEHPERRQKMLAACDRQQEGNAMKLADETQHRNQQEKWMKAGEEGRHRQHQEKVMKAGFLNQAEKAAILAAAAVSPKPGNTGVRAGHKMPVKRKRPPSGEDAQRTRAAQEVGKEAPDGKPLKAPSNIGLGRQKRCTQEASLVQPENSGTLQREQDTHLAHVARTVALGGAATPATPVAASGAASTVARSNHPARGSGAEKVEVLELFQERVLPRVLEPWVSGEELILHLSTKTRAASDADISLLMEAGLITRRDDEGAKSYSFSIPNIGFALKHLGQGRRELVRVFRAAKYKEMSEAVLEGKRLVSSLFGVKFHLRDFIGLGWLQRVNMPSGVVLRLVH